MQSEEIPEKRDPPLFIGVLVNLEYRLITGHTTKRAARSIEKKWSADLAARLNKCTEKPNTYDTYTLCNYISFLQYDESGVKHYDADYEECIARLIKDYLLTSDEITEYNAYVGLMEKRS